MRETGATVYADDHGRFQIPLPSDSEATLVASDREGRIDRSTPFRASRQHGKVPVEDLVLVEEAKLAHGFVHDPSGNSVSGAIVVAKDGAIEHVAVTDGRGEYFITGLCSGVTYDLSVLPHRGLVGARSFQERVQGDLELEMLMSPTELRRVRVTDMEQAPQVGAHLVASDGLRVAHGVADEQGWVEFAGMWPRYGSMPVRYTVRSAALEPLEVQVVRESLVQVAASQPR